MSALFCLFLCFGSYSEKLEEYISTFYKIRYILEELYVAVMRIISRLIIYIDQLNAANDSLLKFEGVTYQYTGRMSLKLSHSFTVLSVLVKLKARKVKTPAIYCHTTSISSISQQFHILQTYGLAFQRFFSFIQENVI